MSSRFDHYPSEPNCQQCRNAFTLLRNAHDTSGSFLEVFNATRKGRPLIKIKIFSEQCSHLPVLVWTP